MSLVSEAAAISAEVTRSLHGETVVLKNRAGSTVATITDAVVHLDPAAVAGAGDDIPDKSGVIRLKGSDRTNALAAFVATTRGIEFQIVHVGEIFGDSFRVELVTRKDQNSHTNKFDLSGKQIPWGSS